MGALDSLMTSKAFPWMHWTIAVSVETFCSDLLAFRFSKRMQSFLIVLISDNWIIICEERGACCFVSVRCRGVRMIESYDGDDE